MIAVRATDAPTEGGEEVQHGIDGTRRGRPHGRAVARGVAGEEHGNNAFADAAFEIGEHFTVPARGHHATRPHGQGGQRRRAAEVARGPAHEQGLAGPELHGEQAAVGD